MMHLRSQLDIFVIGVLDGSIDHYTPTSSKRIMQRFARMELRGLANHVMLF